MDRQEIIYKDVASKMRELAIMNSGQSGLYSALASFALAVAEAHLKLPATSGEENGRG